MAYFVEKMEHQLADAISRPEGWVERDPGYRAMYEDNSRMRNQHEEQGITRLHRPDWKWVARIQSTLEDANRFIQPQFLRDKREFYGWLDRNPQYCTYDRRRGRRA